MAGLSKGWMDTNGYVQVTTCTSLMDKSVISASKIASSSEFVKSSPNSDPVNILENFD